MSHSYQIKKMCIGMIRFLHIFFFSRHANEKNFSSICGKGSVSILGYIQVHKDEMADASAHYKQVKDLMGAEILMPGIENRQL